MGSHNLLMYFGIYQLDLQFIHYYRSHGTYNVIIASLDALLSEGRWIGRWQSLRNRVQPADDSAILQYMHSKCPGLFQLNRGTCTHFFVLFDRKNSVASNPALIFDRLYVDFFFLFTALSIVRGWTLIPNFFLINGANFFADISP